MGGHEAQLRLMGDTENAKDGEDDNNDGAVRMVGTTWMLRKGHGEFQTSC